MYFSSQARPSVIIFTSLPPPSGFTKIVSSASPRLRFRIADAGVIRSLPSFVQPCALRFADNSAQALFTFALVLNPSCSTRALYSTSDASFVSARSFTFNPADFGLTTTASLLSSSSSESFVAAFISDSVLAGFSSSFATAV